MGFSIVFSDQDSGKELLKLICSCKQNKAGANTSGINTVTNTVSPM